MDRVNDLREQVEKLTAENKRLRNELELVTLLMDVGLTVIEEWWKHKGQE